MNSEQIMVKMVLDRWYALIKNFDAIMSALTDEQLQKEIAPGKNRGIYLLGHMAAVHDDMFPLLDLGNKLYPELNRPFIEEADNPAAAFPPIAEIRAAWIKVNTTLAKKFDTMETSDWFQKHTAIAAEDFAKEPHRNKLNVIVTRISHMAWHTGQIVLLQDSKYD